MGGSRFFSTLLDQGILTRLDIRSGHDLLDLLKGYLGLSVKVQEAVNFLLYIGQLGPHEAAE